MQRHRRMPEKCKQNALKAFLYKLRWNIWVQFIFSRHAPAQWTLMWNSYCIKNEIKKWFNANILFWRITQWIKTKLQQLLPQKKLSYSTLKTFQNTETFPKPVTQTSALRRNSTGTFRIVGAYWPPTALDMKRLTARRFRYSNRQCTFVASRWPLT